MLQRHLKFKMTTTVIKQIKRMAGGIDQYLLTTRNELLLYPKAIQIKRNLRQLARLRFRDEAIAAQEPALVEGGGAEAAALLPKAPTFNIPGLWQHEHGGSIGFPGVVFRKSHKPDKWRERHTKGHAWNR